MTQTAILERENKQLKQQILEGVELLERVGKNVGTDLGQDIDQYKSKVKGQRFNPNDWNMNDRNGEQGI